jgi:hypothetical protein
LRLQWARSAPSHALAMPTLAQMWGGGRLFTEELPRWGQLPARLSMNQADREWQTENARPWR